MPPLQKPSGGSRGMGGGVDDDFSGVEISITEGVEKTVCAPFCPFFFFSFFFF